jgi:hypothetical protein
VPASLFLDDRLWHLDTFSSLEQSHPSIIAGLKTCVGAYQRVDFDALRALIAARGEDQVTTAQKKGEAALHSAMMLGGMLNPLVQKLERAVGDAGGSAPAELHLLLEAARQNRSALTEQAPALVAQALRSSPRHERIRAAAEEAVEGTVRRLESMRARSEQPSVPYRELAPMVERLKQIWAALDRALAPLSRQAQESIRRPLADEMTTAARALTRNLYLRKSEDRGRGAWPPPVINPGGTVPEQFAAALASGNYSAATTLLAPWLTAEWPAARLRESMEQAAEEIMTGFDLPVAPRPGGYDVGANPLELAELREDGMEIIPEDITEDNFRGWWPTQILMDEEDAWLTDIGSLASYFVLVVEVEGKQRIGYLRFEP